MSEKPAKLNLDILYPDQRAALIQELDGATVVITDNLVKAYKDGKELDAHLDMIGGVLRLDNAEGIYRVSADGEESDQGEQKPNAEMTNLVSDIWAKRTNRVSDEQAVANLKNVYANRQAQFTA